MPLSTGQILNNRYRIVTLLGQGGFGAVYRVWDTNLERPLALKENLDTSPEAQRQFKREAQILFDLSHPSLPKVIDCFILPDQGQYLVMEFVEGEDLGKMLERVGNPLAEGQVLAWIGQICDALIYLHNQNPPVIHRDIKPANIKVTPDGRAMLVDFGIAKVYDPNLKTTLGARAVTPGFSPIEQYGRGGRTDARTDVYALGATLYALLTGQEPVEAPERNISLGLPPPRSLNTLISPHVERAIMKAMEMIPESRYQSVAELKNALLQTPVGEPVNHYVMVARSPATSALQPEFERQKTQEVYASGWPRMPTIQAPAADNNPPTSLILRPLLLIAAGGLLAGCVVVIVAILYKGLLSPSSTSVDSASRPTYTEQALSPATEPPPTRTEPPVLTEPPAVTEAPVITEPPVQPTAPPVQPTAPPVQPSTPRLVLDGNFYCRGGPGTAYDQIWSFNSGTELEIIGQDGTGWWLVQFSDPRTSHDMCWISGGVTQGDVLNVPFSNYQTVK